MIGAVKLIRELDLKATRIHRITVGEEKREFLILW